MRRPWFDIKLTPDLRFQRKTRLNAKEAEYRQIGEDALKTSYKILRSGGWKQEKKLQSTGDVVCTKTVNGKKLFRLSVRTKVLQK